MLSVRGRLELHAYADGPRSDNQTGDTIVVIEYHPPRTVVVSQA